MTACRIHRNNAEERIKAMHKNDRMTKAGDNKPVLKTSDTTTDDEVQNDNFEELITDNIPKYIQSKFKGYKMECLIEATLKSQRIHKICRSLRTR